MATQSGIPKGMIDAVGLCEVFNVQAQTVQRWGRNGTIPKPVMRLGRKLLWNEDVVEEIRRAFVARVDAHHNMKPKKEAA